MGAAKRNLFAFTDLAQTVVWRNSGGNNSVLVAGNFSANGRFESWGENVSSPHAGGMGDSRYNGGACKLVLHAGLR